VQVFDHNAVLSAIMIGAAQYPEPQRFSNDATHFSIEPAG
jgi:hypothetical protein